jgi:hypothetical protein
VILKFIKLVIGFNEIFKRSKSLILIKLICAHCLKNDELFFQFFNIVVCRKNVMFQLVLRSILFTKFRPLKKKQVGPYLATNYVFLLTCISSVLHSFKISKTV